ncbi:hypothetical protein [Escherichia coli]|uniref:hypothetical protein n=1 Tax=Escherichia coli TaxID=562 RepID=UPI0013024C0F|nr:hypothetical protein [Escherichia coli]KAE9667092.1 hypothetical protein GP723_11330 [Escherichia coli]KAE9671783.1 hypothetical protein GP722_08300 [Escherichia coli]
MNEHANIGMRMLAVAVKKKNGGADVAGEPYKMQIKDYQYDNQGKISNDSKYSYSYADMMSTPPFFNPFLIRKHCIIGAEILCRVQTQNSYILNQFHSMRFKD